MDEVVKLKPAIKSYIWGGQYFQKYFNSDLDVISELWILSLRGKDSSVIASGPNSGKPLVDILTKEDIGPLGERFPYFPLLIKLIDAKENLSVQVHPSDEYALKNENSFGKSEMWHIISADQGAGLYIGLKKDYSKEEIEVLLRNNNILEAMNFFEVKPGETYVINPGTLHAIGKGVRLIEIQQNSDLTYRLYDYLRKDANGNYRELHIDKALKVIDYQKYKRVDTGSSLLVENQYFKVSKYEVNDELTISADEGSFVSFTFLNGEGLVNDIPYHRFETFFVPFNKKAVIKGQGTIVASSIGNK